MYNKKGLLVWLGGGYVLLFLKTAQRCSCFPVFGQLGCSCVVYLVVNRSFTFLNSSAVGLNSSPLYSM
jgi:hypothetical protein|nr:MAG TPA: major capsid protein [Caudoviricetes sp.]